MSTTTEPTVLENIAIIDSDSIDQDLAVIDHELLAVEDFDAANAARTRIGELTKLSVIVPVYNERWTVEQLLRQVLTSQVDLDIEVIVVDDGSTDGSAEVVERLVGEDDRIKLVRHPKRRGKGRAIRTAIHHITGDIAVIQDADLEYNPDEFPKLIRPIVDGRADAVFGSRYAGPERRVLLFWHSLGNRLLTLLCNALNDLNLTDMETCYKAIRVDILRGLNLKADSFTIEVELTTRLAQWGARIYEVPISYRGRSIEDGKKTHAIDGIKAIWAMFFYRWLDTRFTFHTGMFVLRSVEKARSYNRWIVDRISPWLGTRVAEAGAGIGNMSRLFADREHVLLADHDPIYLAALRDTFQTRSNVRVAHVDLTAAEFETDWIDDRLDTIFCSNVLEHLGPHRKILSSFHNALTPEGHCIIIVPAEPAIYNGLDTSLGHHRRYTADELRTLMSDVGFDIVHSEQVCKLGALAWFVNGNILRKRRLTPRQMLTFDRLWPIVQLFDRFLPWRGMSLIVIGKKRGEQVS